MRRGRPLRVHEGRAVRVRELLLLDERGLVSLRRPENAHQVSEKRHLDEGHFRDSWNPGSEALVIAWWCRFRA